MRFFVLPVLAPALLERFGLGLLRESSEQVGMAGGDAFGAERLRYGRDELQKRQTRIDVGGALTGLVDQRGHVVTGHVEQALETLRLFVRMDVDALAVLDQLPKNGFVVADIDDAGGKGEEFRKLRGAESSRSSNNLESLGVGAYGDGLNQSVGANGFGEFA